MASKSIKHRVVGVLLVGFMGATGAFMGNTVLGGGVTPSSTAVTPTESGAACLVCGSSSSGDVGGETEMLSGDAND